MNTNPLLNGTKVYVIQSRRRDMPHKANEMPWYLARADVNQVDPVYTTDPKEAQTFSSLISADLYAVALDQDNPTYHHMVDVLSRS